MTHHLELTRKSESELPEISKQLLSFAKDTKVWIFNGQLGVGKTTLIKALAQQIGVLENMSSPSFSIINEYTTANNATVYHLDLYRLKNLQEAIDVGIEDYLFSGLYCFIEWPEIIEDILPEKHMALELKIQDFTERTIKASRYE